MVNLYESNLIWIGNYCCITGFINDSVEIEGLAFKKLWHLGTYVSVREAAMSICDMKSWHANHAWCAAESFTDIQNIPACYNSLRYGFLDNNTIPRHQEPEDS